MYEPVRREIVGESVIAMERVLKARQTKNSIRQRIERVHQRALLLECGHKVPVSHFGAQVPKNHTGCMECVLPRENGAWKEVEPTEHLEDR